MKMSQLINYRLDVTAVDGRHFVGTLLAFDGHMNLVMADTVEKRLTKKAYAEMVKTHKPNYDTRNIGLMVLRGDQVVSIVIESEPLTPLASRLEKGTGTAKPVAKGVKRKRDS
ncbi:hypothetical protein DIURU_003101 [Diutina rugosa]|uniref:Sm protein B n=1 Tax=Diutina rugosa TaxID=5481 RepID=A0A642UMH9_DIURU|nr:uncharacterized protein DIURU_003101 [Diutina rugosa]KAA8901736.1 hypothetical protein DIURU_003101 [Diutina rugosa]